jgi:hypothetical protein
MSSVPVPGLCGLLRNPSSRRMEALNRNPEAQASGEHRCMALLRVQLRDDLSPRRKTAVRTSAITMRPGWLAQAAFVFAAPSSSTPFDSSYPRLPTLVILKAGEVARVHTGWALGSSHQLMNKSVRYPSRCVGHAALLLLVTQHGDECHRFLPPRRLD